MMNENPKWISILEKKIGWFSLPNLALYLIVLQIFGLIISVIEPAVLGKLVLDPEKILAGEYWRLITFLGIPGVQINESFFSYIFTAFFLMFLFFIINTLEQNWGEFKTTLYLFISVIMTIAFSFLFNVPIGTFSDIEISLFLAVATLFPNVQILIFFFPLPLKYVIIPSVLIIIYHFFTGNMYYKIYVGFVYANYLLFFGPYYITSIKNKYRRWKYLKNSKK